MKKGKFFLIVMSLFLGLTPGGAAEKTKKDDVLEAKSRCEGNIPVSREGLVDMSAGFSSVCQNMQMIESELVIRTDPKDVSELNAGLKAAADLVVTGRTPSEKDAKNICRVRLAKKKKGNYRSPKYAEVMEAMAKNCAFLKKAEVVVKRQSERSPVPAVYFSNLVAVNIAFTTIVTNEETLRIFERIQKKKSKSKKAE